jgi:cobalt/nickel transport system permease protein
MQNSGFSHTRAGTMHIPDGFIDLQTATATAALAGIGIAIALRDVRRHLPPRRVPLIGLAAAFVFAAQMLNFPVAAGTSGHLIGAVLVCVLLGPAAAVIVMTTVLVLQCLMFADGGVTALGANVLNMGVIAPTVGYTVHSVLRRRGPGGLRSVLLAAGFAAWCSTLAAALACAVQLAASGAAPWNIALPAMGGVHMLIGLGEAVITMLVVAVVARARPELIDGTDSGPMSHRALLAYGGLATLALLVFVAPVASSLPDGLDWVAGRLTFAQQATTLRSALLEGYSLDVAAASPAMATVLAGLIGAAVAFAVAWLVARALTPASRSPATR